MNDPLARLKDALSDRYTIERELGSGGMATVYLAHDLKHDRKVAVKVLRPELSAILGGERFLNEIKVTANLQHPNILPLFESGEADTFLYYVMPYIEGETLRDKLNREKQLAVEETVEIAKSVAGALSFAHSHGVIHRDIKPENILLQSGQALVADFGIALAVTQAGGTRLTETGLSLGTPHYMSPEQAAGDRELDPRSDVYSLGAMVYEMLAGEPPHTGPTVQSILAKIAADKPRPITELRDAVPPNVAFALDRALAKVPADRPSSAAKFAATLLDDTAGLATVSLESHSPGTSRRAIHLTWASATLVALSVAYLVWSPPPPLAPVSHFDITLPAGHQLASGRQRPFAVSPDGRRFAFVARSEVGAARLFVRERSEPDARALPGTEGARDPFFSPDGEWIGYFSGTGMFKVPVSGGRPQPVTNSPAFSIGLPRWGLNDSIIFPLAIGLFQVSAAGGEAEELPSVEELQIVGQPTRLSGGNEVLATVTAGQMMGPAVLNLETGTWRRAEQLRGADVVEYLPDGKLIYIRGGLLSSVPFDMQRLEPTGSSRPIVDSVGQWAAVTPTIVAYVKARPVTPVWVDRQGRAVPVSDFDFGDVQRPSLSPDGSRFTYESASGRRLNLRWYDLERHTSNMIPGEGTADAIWSPDGNSITFQEIDARGGQIVSLSIDGEAAPEVLIPFSEGSPPSPHSWSPDGRYLAYYVQTPTGRDIRILERGEGSRDFIVTEFNERSPAFSPDGRWIAYVSDRSGQSEVWVTSFPRREVTERVSAGGGRSPLWSGDGREIFYRWGDAVFAVDVRTRPTLDVGVPDVLFRGPYIADAEVSGSPDYDVALDGRFLMFQQELPNRIHVILNWASAER